MGNVKNSVWEVHAIFHGRVQGVFFRANTVDIAKNLALTGTVKNIHDGTVEVFAQGPKKTLEKFIEVLCGPDGPGHVTQVTTHYHPAAVPFESFKIIY